MHRFILILTLFISSCGSEGSQFEINTNGFPVDMEMVQYAFNSVEDNYNNIFQDDLNLWQLAQGYSLNISYRGQTVGQNGIPTNNRGLYFSNKRIQVKFNKRNDWAGCSDNYYVLAHELLHFVCDVYRENCPGKFGDSHYYPNFFMTWLYSLDQEEWKANKKNTIELVFYWDIRRKCKELYPIEEYPLKN